jgi:hypothetical protein
MLLPAASPAVSRQSVTLMVVSAAAPSIKKIYAAMGIRSGNRSKTRGKPVACLAKLPCETNHLQ